MYTIEEILNMDNPCELFSGDEKRIKDEYTSLLKKYHPDINGNSEDANNATIKINKFYTEALELIKLGKWITKDKIQLKATDGSIYYIKYNIKSDFELGSMYIGDNALLYIIKEENTIFAENYIKRVENLNYADYKMKDEFEKYMPKILASFKTLSREICIVVRKTEDLYRLTDLLKFSDNKIDSKHVAWILSSLYNISCFIEFNRLSLNSITLDACFISTQNHYVAILGGFWYSVGIGERMIGVPVEVFNVIPKDTKELKRGSTLTDLASIKLLGRTLLGDKTGVNLILDANVPEPITEWLRIFLKNSSYAEYNKWNDVLDKSYGNRRFIKYEIDKNKFYNKLKRGM